MDRERIQLTREVISADDLAAAMRRSDAGAAIRRTDAGAAATFEGAVRAERNAAGQSLAALKYTAYEEMAREQMRELRERALRDFAILDAALAHRLGRMTPGEVSVAVAVVAAHRGPAFAACRWLIDTLKADVPIWKQEVWDDGNKTWSAAAAKEPTT